MAVIQVGTIAYRDGNGDFLSPGPIMRDVPEIKYANKFISQEDIVMAYVLDRFDVYAYAMGIIEKRRKKRRAKKRDGENNVG